MQVRVLLSLGLVVPSLASVVPTASSKGQLALTSQALMLNPPLALLLLLA